MGRNHEVEGSKPSDSTTANAGRDYILERSTSQPSSRRRFSGEACTKGASWSCTPAVVGSIPSLSTNRCVRGVPGGIPGFQPGGASSNLAGRSRSTARRSLSTRVTGDGRLAFDLLVADPNGQGPVCKSGTREFDSPPPLYALVVQRKDVGLLNRTVAVRIRPRVPMPA